MRHHIISIGISKHQDPDLASTLLFAARDAERFFDLFTNSVGDIGYRKRLINTEATLSQIRSSIGTELAREVAPDDAVFFFFSGHGATGLDADGKSKQHFLVPYDATHDIANSCVAVSYLQEAFDLLHARARLVFVDSCFSGAINSKSIPSSLSLKSGIPLKAITESVRGKGSAVFSACKAEEMAIEDQEFMGGLFTHFVLNELQRDSSGKGTVSISDIFHPVMEGVVKRAAEKYRHEQTPTINSHLEGPLELPVFRSAAKLRPTLQPMPAYPELAAITAPPPNLDISEADLASCISDILKLVASTCQIHTPPTNRIVFESVCIKIVKGIRMEWEEILASGNKTTETFPMAIAQLEAASFQLMVLAAAIAAVGSPEQMSLFAKIAVEIKNFGKQKSGQTGVLAIPDLIVGELIYLIGVVAIANGNLPIWNRFLRTLYFDPEASTGKPSDIVLDDGYYHCPAFADNADKCHDHYREYLKKQDWLIQICPAVEGKIGDLQLQANFLVVMLCAELGRTRYPDFGRFYASRIRPLIQQIKYVPDWTHAVAAMFKIGEAAVRPQLIAHLKNVKMNSLGRNYFWHSIDLDDLRMDGEQ